jgi:hypothetical protein
VVLIPCITGNVIYPVVQIQHSTRSLMPKNGGLCNMSCAILKAKKKLNVFLQLDGRQKILPQTIGQPGHGVVPWRNGNTTTGRDYYRIHRGNSKFRHPTHFETPRVVVTLRSCLDGKVVTSSVGRSSEQTCQLIINSSASSDGP